MLSLRGNVSLAFWILSRVELFSSQICQLDYPAVTCWLKGLDYTWLSMQFFRINRVNIGTSGRRSSRLPFRGLTGTTIVDCYFHHSFTLLLFFHFSATTFSHRRNARIKKLILWKLTGAPKNWGVDTFSDSDGHLGAPWRPFWILQAVRCYSGEKVPPAPLGWYFYA